METNVRRTKKPMKLEDMTKEQIRQAILKKKECDAKALKIVQSLLEEGVTEDYLLQCLPNINQAHFDDVVEERSITQICGYPICERTISDKDIPKQKYRISLKTNKVYDITARKNFCSNSCYKSAMYVKQQMLTSPLWFREHEEIPTFNLLPRDSAGSIGQEVDIGSIERVEVSTVKKFTSINDFASASLKDIDAGDDEHKSSIADGATKKTESDIECNNVIETAVSGRINKKEPVRVGTVKSEPTVVAKVSEKPIHKEDKKPSRNTINIVGDIIEKPERKIDPILTQQPEVTPKDSKLKKLPQKKQPFVTALANEVEKYLAQWFTLDTMLLLFGEQKVREMVTVKGEYITEYLNNYAKGIFYNNNTYDQYQQLCKKLNMLEIGDKLNNTKTLKKEMKPLPDYSILQEESKRMELKVQAFMSGETDISEPDVCEKEQPPDEDNVTQLPLVDKNAQNAIRRRIVCQHLNKVLPDLLRSLGLQALTISSDVRLLVNTFKLQANNIMFKPIQWTLIALIFIKLLSIRDKRLGYLLEQPMAFQHMQLLLLSYKLDGGYLERLISWLTDIDRLLDTNDTQLTIETF